MGRAGLINSGGASGKNDLAQAVRTAVINKRAGGMGLISGRKAFQRPMAEGVDAAQRDPGRVPLQGGDGRLACILASFRLRPTMHTQRVFSPRGAQRTAKTPARPEVRTRLATAPRRPRGEIW